MLRIKSLLVVAAAATIITGNATAQDCASCSSSVVSGSYGYPSAGCSGGCGFGGRFHSPENEQRKEYHSLVTARNDAWPKPFNCADRQVYHNVWVPMIDGGFEEHCVLNAVHFDADTNELNAFGRHAVAGIMQNMPSHRKHVFVTRDANPNVSSTRLAHVENMVRNYYGELAPNAVVAFSQKQPASVSGVRAETISQQFIQGQPAPIIPISSGSTSVSSSVTQ